jgi:hypothetical protein
MVYSIIILSLSMFLSGKSVEGNGEILTFTWAVAGDTIARIEVPKGFKESNWEYGEGIVTNLTYADSSYIVLHYGLDISLPLLKSPEHLIYNEVKKSNRTIRYGRVQHTKLRWREESLYPVPINIAFSRVPANRLKTFERSLASIVIIKK